MASQKEEVYNFLKSSKNKLQIGSVYARKDLIEYIEKGSGIKDVGGGGPCNPTNYLYNSSMTPKYTPDLAYFERDGKGEYKVLGAKAKYSGNVTHKSQNGKEEVIGSWKNGKFSENSGPKALR